MKNHITLPIKIGLICSALLLWAFAPKGDDPIEKIVSVLQKWTDSIPQEKVYLHMDKPYYALGDTIWFKGYITIGSRNQLSALSGSLYVDLINEQDSILSALKLPITSGMVMGNFTLGDDYKIGNYRIRAYTQWMRNAGPDYFYDHTFPVGDLLSHNIVTRADYQYKTVNNKSILTAILNYSDDNGKPLANKDVHYRIMINKKVMWSQSVKTDAQGNIPVKIANDDHVDLSGSYIRTTVEDKDNYTITRDFPIKARLSETDVQFFPESGNLVNGLVSRVAFKAVGVDGLGAAIKGKVVDDANKEVVQMETTHAGMGNFVIRPVAGKTYSAQITFADGSTKAFPLPKAMDEGYVMGVYQPNKDSVLIRINASTALRQGSVNIVVHTRGETVYASTVRIAGSTTPVWLDKKLFPSGIAQFTLFNDGGEPLNERIAFIRGDDRMQLNLNSVKSTYHSKERIGINLEAKNHAGKSVPGNYSVSVINESKVPVNETDESTIFSNLLLTSDLKGFIEKPNYYFTGETPDITKALDNLMLTQGYRRFTWKELNNTVSSKPSFEPEGLGFKITGKVLNLGGKIVPNANVTLLSLRAKITKFTSTDANGQFKFDGIFLTDSIKFMVQARTAKNSAKLMVVLDTIPKILMTQNPNLGDISTNINGTMKAYIENGKKEDDIYEKLGQLDKVHRLREVRIKARKKEASPYAIQAGLRIPEGLADQTFVMTKMDDCPMLGSCLQGQLKFVIFKAKETESGMIINYPYVLYNPPVGPPAYVPALVVLDGRKLFAQEIGDIFDSNYIDPAGIAKIDVVRSSQGAMTMLGGPALMIFTKRDYIRSNYNPSVVNISPKGFNKVREFYAPRYDQPGNAATMPDLRTTVYWNPYVKTDEEGKTSFNFFNADGPGTYKVIVEGINADGELGRQVYRYTVNGEQSAADYIPAAAADKNLALITAPLDSFNKRLPAEKVYLHTDKPYYNIGDTLWFKSYLVDRAHQTGSKLSGLLYVELDNDSSEMVRRISIRVKDGIAWGQIPLPKTIFREGGYTLRAYTNWMQNFGEDFTFSQRFYLGVPTQEAWLVKSSATINRVADRDQLEVQLYLNHSDNTLSPVAVHKVEVKIYDEWHYLYKEELQTGIDGSLKFSHALKDKSDGRRVRVQITGLAKEDGDKVIQVPLLINRNQNIDLQFLPEGGKLVSGLKSVVGFKALAENGKGIAVLGGIYDGKGTELTTLTTLHNGMGSFEFTPKTGEVYTARISQPIAKSFELPKINPTGTVVHINNPEVGDAISVSLSGLNAIGTDSACYLIGTSRGTVYYSQKVDLNQPALSVAKKLFPTGIARFTLFKGRQPLNQRMVFIDNGDRLNIKIIPNKNTFVKRDKVALDIEVKDKSGYPVQGNFSLAVTDDSQVKPDSLDNNGIAANLLISSELKGNIEEPGYYVNRVNKQSWRALDNLMLTQGWAGYDWKDIFKPDVVEKFKAEKDFKITGHVSSLTNKPVAGEEVLISSQKPSFVLKTNTDAEGNFEFNKLPAIDSGSFFMQATKASGKAMNFGNVSINKFHAPLVPEALAHPVLPWYVNTDTTQINYVRRRAALANDNLRLTGNVLREVKIKDKKVIAGSSNRNGPGRADLVFDEQDIKESAVMNLYQLLKQKLPGIKVISERNMPTLKLNDHFVIVLIDGGGLPIQLDIPPTVDDLIAELSKFQIAQFKGMEVMYSEDNLVKYLQPRINWISRQFKGMEIAASEYHLISGDESMSPWVYKSEYKPGYLERRANVFSNKTPEIVSIDITTKAGNGWYTNQAPAAVTYRPLPVMRPQEFYSPKYNAPSPPVSVPDYRSTLYWEPNIVTDANGKAKVSFYTSDIKDKFTVKVAGIDGNGNLGDGTVKLNK